MVFCNCCNDDDDDIVKMEEAQAEQLNNYTNDECNIKFINLFLATFFVFSLLFLMIKFYPPTQI